MEEDLFQLRQLPVVKFRRTGESARSEDDTASGEHEVQIEGVRAGLEAVELDDGAAVPKEFANPTDGEGSLYHHDDDGGDRDDGGGNDDGGSDDGNVDNGGVDNCGGDDDGDDDDDEGVVMVVVMMMVRGVVMMRGGSDDDGGDRDGGGDDDGDDDDEGVVMVMVVYPDMIDMYKKVRAILKDDPVDNTFMVEDAVEAIGFGKFQWKLSMADAMEMMILSILAPQLHCEWRLPSWQVALLTSVVFVGMMSSSTLWGNISDQYGRKTGLKISVLWTLYYGILSAFAPVYSWILVLRGLVGFGIGGVPQSVTLYAEFLPMKARAKCILLIEVFWAIGTVFEVILAVFVMPSLGWRWLLILSAVPLLLFAVLCFVGNEIKEQGLWLPESARYDVLSGNQEKAIATLKRIATENGAPMPLGKLIISRQEDRGKMRDLFTPHFRWTTLLLWFIWFSNAFSYYGLVLLTTELFQAGDVCSISSRKKAVEAKCSLACEYLSKEDYMDLLWTTLSEFPDRAQ
ncbi:Synaptic vesicle 2-related protein [Camelus dromedarius]|uniref:Synaptic vesicle 2-related protein n=1 Tax=Camelus dromedarius TaxID=9838 RepID=A0A5N4C9H9_CAMDR|nr:Synaptic vesicle 2-related protein [Camelus dromedarius]